MENCSPGSVCKFNSMYTDKNLNKLKVISSKFQNYPLNLLALYIKVMEVKYTLEKIRSCPHQSIPDVLQQLGSDNIKEMCTEIQPFCNESEQNFLATILNLLESMSNMQEMMQMMELMQEFTSDGNNSNNINNLTGGLGNNPEELFSLFSAFFSTGNDNGGDHHE